MNDFLYIYRGGQRPTGTPEQMQNTMQKWMTWMKELGDQGHIKDIGHPLEPAGKVVKAHRTVIDGPFAEAKDLVGGYTLVQAKDLAQAADLASGCPIFEFGGFVEVRPIRAM